MGDITVHRGPDDSGMHADERAIIAMRRLSIIDVSGGHQPISNADDSVWVVCNGEIYNFLSLSWTWLMLILTVDLLKSSKIKK